jgi:hypothetical protein
VGSGQVNEIHKFFTIWRENLWKHAISGRFRENQLIPSALTSRNGAVASPTPPGCPWSVAERVIDDDDSQEPAGADRLITHN